MRFILNLLKSLFLFSLLTLITQVGGIIYLLYKPVSWRIKRSKKKKLVKFLLRLGVFSVMYLLICFVIIPPLAKKSGRVPLAVFATEETPIKPRSLFYALANRNYVAPPLKDLIVDAATNFNKKYPAISLSYLDANFPFGNGFPLLPHRSHDDGKKLDLTFIYKNKKTDKYTTRIPSLLGYGACEGPKAGETDMPGQCKQKGYWQYNLLQKITPQRNEQGFEFDKKATKDLLLMLAQEHRTGKIFLEPHLKKRLGLSHLQKIRFHGCQAVRHDDHIHLQL